MTARQQRFCEEYLVDLNATQAAIRAGYSAATARVAGCKNMKKPAIAACIEKEMQKRSQRTGISADRIVQELARIAFVQTSQVVDIATGALKPGANANDLAAVAAVKVKKTEQREEWEVKFADKIKALELLGRHCGMWNDKADASAPVQVVIAYDYGDDDADDTQQSPV